MKVTPAVLMHPEDGPVSFSPGSASHREHAGSFAHMFRGSLGKPQAVSPSSHPSQADTVPSEGTSVKVLLAGTAAAKSGAATRSAPIAPTATEAEPAAQAAATPADHAKNDARPTQGRPTAAPGAHRPAEAGSRESATQGGSRGSKPATSGAAPAGQGHANQLEQEPRGGLPSEGRDTAAGRDSAQALPVTTEPLSLASEKDAIGGDLKKQPNDSAAKNPGAAISTSAAARPILTKATSSAPAANSVRGQRSEDGSRALDPARLQASLTAPGLPLPAQVDWSSPKTDAELASGPSFTPGPVTPPAVPAGAAEGARATRGIARFAAAAAAATGANGTDSPPHLLSRVSHAPTTPAATAHSPVTPAEAPAGAAEEARAAHGIARFLAASVVSQGHQDGQLTPPPRAPRAPLAAPATTPATTPATATATTTATTTVPVPTAATAAFGGNGTDSPPHLLPHASHAPVVPQGHQDGQPPPLPRAPLAASVSAAARPVVTANGPAATHGPGKSLSAKNTPAGEQVDANTANAGASIASLPVTTQTSSFAPLVAQPAQPAGLAHPSPSSGAPHAHDESAASKDAPPVSAGPTSHPARPAPAAPPPAAPITAAALAADAGPSPTPANQAPAESRDRTGVASGGRRARAQDSADDPKGEQSPSLPSFVATHDAAAPSPPIHHMRESERAAVADHSRASPTGDGKETGGATHASLPDQIAAGQTRLHAETQVTPSTPQAPLPSTPPVHVPAASGPTNAAAADPRLAVHLPTHASNLAAQVAQNDGLTMTVMPNAARMAIESPDGDLDLRMRVHHGSAEITVGGSMAPLFHARAPEARAALASEGLALGNFDSGQSGGGQQGQPAPETLEAPGAAPAPYRPHQGVALPATPTDGRIHVTA